MLDQALHAQGQTVMIGGEPGVGKSRLAGEIATWASANGFISFVGSCYDREDPNPFIPFVEILESALGRAPTPEAFRRTIGGDAAELARLMPQLRRLFPDIPPSSPMLIEQARRTLFKAIADTLARAATENPLLILVEDLQWADEGTLSLFTNLTRAVRNWPAIIIATYRDIELDPSGSLYKSLDEMIRLRLAEHIHLTGLTDEAVAEMLRALSGKAPPPAIVKLFGSHTDGNPFFVEELYYHLKDQGRLVDSEGNFVQGLKVTEIDVPDSLRLVIGRRLVRLSPASQKRLATAALIGHSFTFELLHSSTGDESDSLLDSIEETEKAGLISSTLQYPDAVFTFSHEMIRQTVLAGLSAARRQLTHLRVAEAIERLYSNCLNEHAADFAHHLWNAGNRAEPIRTVGSLAAAAKQAITRSAVSEAIVFLSRALELLRSLPPDPSLKELELDLLVRLGMVLTFTKGYSSPEVQRTYNRARELCQQVGESSQLFRILRGLAGYFFVRAEHAIAFDLAKQCLSLAERLNDNLLLVGGHMEVGASLFCLGEHIDARAHLERAVALGDVGDEGKVHAVLHGQDFGVSARARLAHVLWFLGYAEQAMEKNEEALTMARKVSHPFQLAYALVFSAVLNQFLGRPEATEEYAQSMIDLAKDQGFSLWIVSGSVLHGWALAAQGKSRGIGQMTDGLATWGSIGTDNTHTYQPYFLALLCEVYEKIGEIRQGLSVLDIMSAAIERTGERFYEPEFYRLKGELLLKMNDSSEAGINEIETCLQKAIAIARHQKAKSLELRATVSLSRFQIVRGKKSEAKSLLSELYDSFTEGLETADLRSAKLLLDQLASNRMN